MFPTELGVGWAGARCELVPPYLCWVRRLLSETSNRDDSETSSICRDSLGRENLHPCKTRDYYFFSAW